MNNVKLVVEPGPLFRGFDHVEMYVGNVRYAAHYFRTVWGFEPVAYRGLDTGSKDRVSMVLRHGGVLLVLTGAVDGSSEVSEWLRLHGEGAARVGLCVSDAESAFSTTVSRGAIPVQEPRRAADDAGELVTAEVRSFDGFNHVFVERASYSGIFEPGFRPIRSHEVGPTGEAIAGLDHVAVCVEGGSLERWAEFYHDVFGFVIGQREDVATEYSGMNSIVVLDPSGRCKFPLVEPAPGRNKSQVQDFINYYGGCGIQHLAVASTDIRKTVRDLRQNGVEFLGVPSTYYETLEKRVGGLGRQLDEIRELGILVDRDASGQLLQTFARPCIDRPTMFFEVIERRGALGFGAGNIRALFEAVEREQAARGTV